MWNFAFLRSDRILICQNMKINRVSYGWKMMHDSSENRHLLPNTLTHKPAWGGLDFFRAPWLLRSRHAPHVLGHEIFFLPWYKKISPIHLNGPSCRRGLKMRNSPLLLQSLCWSTKLSRFALNFELFYVLQRCSDALCSIFQMTYLE